MLTVENGYCVNVFNVVIKKNSIDRPFNGMNNLTFKGLNVTIEG